MNKLGKFEIIAKVGQGAMGVVYKAHDPHIDRIVALKTLSKGLAEDPNLLKRFYSEARSAGSLRHPNIVTIYELGHEGEIPFIAMQFLSGESLDKIIDRFPNLPVSQKIGFIVYVCRALDYAHKRTPPVIHRDIKPGNVMVAPDGSVVVVDFGIARLGETSASLSAGLLVGTLGYMAPELFRGATADPRSDIWATGVTFYELLAYRRPFKADSAAALMSSIVLESHRPILEAAPGTPEEIAGIIDRMLAKDPGARYQSMEEVLSDLEPIWERLLQGDISILLQNSQNLLQEGDLLAAKSELGLILHWDPSNTQARTLSDRINSELRRQQSSVHVKALVENAQKLFAEGRSEEAKSEAEAALKLDPSWQPAREMLDQVCAAMERASEINRAINVSKQRASEGALTEAETQLDKVLEIDPDNAAAQDQLKHIHDERLRRERRSRHDDLLHRARTYWTRLEYDDSIQLLLSAEKDFPEDPEIQKFLETVRHDQAEHRRQTLLAEIRDQLSAQQFEDALKLLDAFLGQFPDDVTAKNLLTHALHGRDRLKRKQQLDEGKSELQSLIKQLNYSETIRRGEELQREFQEDFEISELLLLARKEQFQIEQKRRLSQTTLQLRELLEKGRFQEAMLAAQKALPEFPQNVEILGLLERATKEHAEKEKQVLIKQRLLEVERMLKRQQLTEAIDLARQTITTVGPDSRLEDTLQKAEKEREFREQKRHRQGETIELARTMLAESRITDASSLINEALETKLFSSSDPQIGELLDQIGSRNLPPSPIPTDPSIPRPSSSPSTGDPGKDYVFVRRDSLPELPGHVEPNPGDSVTSASGPGAKPIPPSVFSRSESLAPSASVSGIARQANEQELLGPIEKCLATFLGPMASIIVERSAAKAKDHEELFTLLASRISSEKDRQDFLARKAELLRGVTRIHPVNETSTAESAVRPFIAPSRAELTPAALRRASELLARYVGPVSSILTERAAQRADSLRGLYLILGGYLKEGIERTQFLQDAGFPEP